MATRGDDQSSTSGDREPSPADDKQWQDIISRLGDLHVTVHDPTSHVVRPARDIPSDSPPLSGRDWDGTTQMDAATAAMDAEEHFIPPEPPPVLGGDPLLTLAWAAVLGVPTLWLVMLIIWTDSPRWVGFSSAAVFLAGLGVLFWRMPRHRDPADDDGAVV